MRAYTERRHFAFLLLLTFWPLLSLHLHPYAARGPSIPPTYALPSAAPFRSVSSICHFHFLLGPHTTS